MSKQEVDLIRTWVDNGSPQGDAADLPKPPKFTKGWQIPKPDEVHYIADEPFAERLPAGGGLLVAVGIATDQRLAALAAFRPAIRKDVVRDEPRQVRTASWFGDALQAAPKKVVRVTVSKQWKDWAAAEVFSRWIVQPRN